MEGEVHDGNCRWKGEARILFIGGWLTTNVMVADMVCLFPDPRILGLGMWVHAAADIGPGDLLGGALVQALWWQMQCVCNSRSLNIRDGDAGACCNSCGHG